MMPSTMQSPEAAIPPAVEATRWIAAGSVLALIVLGVAWELWLAPLRPGGSLWAVKVLPLCLALPGVLKRRMYTYRWVSLLVWPYFLEGVVRAGGASLLPALVQVFLCLVLFVACALHVRLRLRHAKP
jgi:uncharacterized membrane protein